MFLVFWFRFVIYRHLPAPLQYAAHMAWYMQVRARNPRNRDRWLSQLSRQWRRWQGRQSDPVICAASQLFNKGWQMCSDWPLIPHEVGEPVYGLKLANGAFPYSDPGKIEFAWDTKDDARPVPVDRVYQMLGLPCKNTEDQLIAWETCFWLSFLTEEALGQAVEKERREKRR